MDTVDDRLSPDELIPFALAALLEIREQGFASAAQCGRCGAVVRERPTEGGTTLTCQCGAIDSTAMLRFDPRAPRKRSLAQLQRDVSDHIAQMEERIRHLRESLRASDQRARQLEDRISARLRPLRTRE